MIPSKVLLVENGTAEGGHARSNLSVLLSVHQAWPDAVLLLACTERHYGALKERMLYCSEPVPACEFLRLDYNDYGPVLYSNKFRTVARQWHDGVSKSRKVLAMARSNKVDLVIDLWANGIRILAIKALKKFYGLGGIAFIHFEHNWDVMKSKRSLKRWLIPHTLDALRVGGNAGHGYGLLHGRMRKDIAAMVKLRTRDNLFEYSYGICWPRSEPTVRSEVHRPIRFGYVSPSFKGLGDFSRLVRLVHDELTQEEWGSVEFRVVGKMKGNRYAERDLRDLVALGVIMPGERLGENEFAREIMKLHYAVHVYDKDYYRIRYSSSIQDTVAFCRPAIMTATGYAKSLRDIEPDYGYLVNSPKEAADVVVSITRAFTEYKYSGEVACATRLRDWFSVARSASQIGSGYALAIGRLQTSQ